MNKWLFLLFIALSVLHVQSAAAKKVVVQHPAPPEYMNLDGTTYVPSSVNYPRVNELEKLIFQAEFHDQPLEIRLSRLEQRVFGATQRGDLNARLDKLAGASTILTSNPQTVQGANAGTKAKSGLANLAKLIGGGQLTGYTPPVYYDPYYAQPYYTNAQQPYGANYPTYNNSNFNSYSQNFGSMPSIPQFSKSGWGQPGGRYSDMFSSGMSNEFYYNDRLHNKDLKSIGGGSGVKVIY